jgi:hypothetical protein
MKFVIELGIKIFQEYFLNTIVNFVLKTKLSTLRNVRK